MANEKKEPGFIVNYKKVDGKKTNEIISYRLRACLGEDESGHRVWISTTIPNDETLSSLTPAKLNKELTARRAAWIKEQKEKLGADGNTYRRSRDDKFASFVKNVWWENWVMHHSPKPLSQLTIDFYRIISNQIIESKQFKNKTLSAIKPEDIDSYINDLKDKVDSNGKKLSAGTVKHHYDVIRIIFNYAEKKDRIEKNPARKADKVILERKPVTRLSMDGIQQFKQALEKKADIKHKLMMYILLDMGLRRGEAAGLQWCNIDFENKTLDISQNVVYSTSEGIVKKDPKSFTSKRKLPMPDNITDLLLKWKEEQNKKWKEQNGENVELLPTAYVFPDERNPYKPTNPQNFTRWSRRFSENNNLPHINPHLLRHTFGSITIANGGELTAVSRYMGHSDIKVTTNNYVGLETDDLRCVSNVIDKIAERQA